MTTAELDAIGRGILEREGARSAPETVYGFPGATCISVNEEVAHGIPGERRIAAGMDFVEGGALPGKECLGAHAVAAALAGIDGDRNHGGPPRVSVAETIL